MRNPATAWSKNSESFENSVSFFGLDYGSVYQMRVQSVCNNDPNTVSDFTQWQNLKIPQPKPTYDSVTCPNCGCDDKLSDVPMGNFDLRLDMAVGDTIVNKNKTSRLIIKKINTNNAGTYEGVCLFWAEIWGLKIPCNFWNLQINTQNTVVNLELESINDPAFMIDIDAALDEINDLTAGLNILFDDAPTDTLEIEGVIETVYVNEAGEVIAVTVNADGTIETRVLGDEKDLEKIVLKDEEGNEYVVTKKGDVMGAKEYIATEGGKKEQVEDYKEKLEEEAAEVPNVLFAAEQSQKYGFDAYTDVKANIQHQYPVLKGTYRPAFKSVAAFTPDAVAISGFTANTLFKDDLGIPAPQQGIKLTLLGGSNESEKGLYAFDTLKKPEQVVGKLNIKSYTQQTKKLYIVSVNGAQIPNEAALKTTLNSIYKQSIIEWVVETGTPLTNIAFVGDKMSHGGSGITTPYNTDQKTIINAFDAISDMDKDASYLFFVSEVVDKDANIAGYMPLSYNAGFIYGLPSNETVAHELGHGTFNLYHTFSTENNISPEGTTQNLMDYAGGTELWHYQWDLIHDPESMAFAWVQDESEGQYTWTPVNEKFAQLFNHVYDYNHIGELKYTTAIETAIADGNTDALEISYTTDEAEDWSETQKIWIDQWKIRSMNSEDVFNDVIKAIKDAGNEEKISKIVLRPKHIYIGKYKYEDVEYPVAIYGNGDKAVMTYVFTKIQVTDVSELDDKEKKKSIYCDETYTKYLIIAFYEDGKSDPSMIMQVEKFAGDDTKEKWLKYLEILKNDDNIPICISGYCCTKCGRDLNLTQIELKQIFPNSTKLDNPDFVKTMNEGFKASGFNKCNHIAHFLAQLKLESRELQSTVEGTFYYPHRMLEIFKGNTGSKFWYEQKFYDDKIYLKYAAGRLYEKMDSEKFGFKVEANDFETFTHKKTGSSIKIPKSYPSHDGHSTAFEAYKDANEIGYYRSIILTDNQKNENGKRLLNAAYAGSNGNSSDTTMSEAEGFKYRGRGFIQVTGKTNYLNAQNTCLDKFKLTYDFINNPDLMKDDIPGLWASFSWFFKNIKIEDLNSEDPDLITYKVNAAGLEKEKRKYYYDELRKGTLKCKK